MNARLQYIALALALAALLAGCGSSKGVTAARATQAAGAPLVATAELLPTHAPAQAATEPVDALAVNGETVSPLKSTAEIAGDVSEFDGFVGEAIPYGALGALQMLALAIATLQHPTRRRVGLALASFALISGAGLVAMLRQFQAVDLLGLGVVTLFGIVAMVQVAKQPSTPVNRYAIRGATYE